MKTVLHVIAVSLVVGCGGGDSREVPAGDAGLPALDAGAGAGDGGSGAPPGVVDLDKVTAVGRVSAPDSMQMSAGIVMRQEGVAGGTCESAGAFGEQVWVLSVLREDGAGGPGGAPLIKSGTSVSIDRTNGGATFALQTLPAACGAAPGPSLVEATSGTVTFVYMDEYAMTVSVSAGLSDGRSVTGTAFVNTLCQDLKFGSGCP